MFYNYTILERIKFKFYKLLYGVDRVRKYHADLMYRDLNRHGKEIITIINEFTLKRDIPYWLMWGTLLGYYREKGIIYGDNDIDIGIFYDDFTLDLVNNLIQHGFKFHEAIVENNYNAYHVAFNYCNVKVDLYSFKKNINQNQFIGFSPGPYKGSWKESETNNIYLNKWFHFPYAGFKKTTFLNVETLVPANDRELLEILYGKNFMTPIPGYKAGANDYIVVDDIGKSYAKRYSYDEFVSLKRTGLI